MKAGKLCLSTVHYNNLVGHSNHHPWILSYPFIVGQNVCKPCLWIWHLPHAGDPESSRQAQNIHISCATSSWKLNENGYRQIQNKIVLRALFRVIYLRIAFIKSKMRMSQFLVFTKFISKLSPKLGFAIQDRLTCRRRPFCCQSFAPAWCRMEGQFTENVVLVWCRSSGQSCTSIHVNSCRLSCHRRHRLPNSKFAVLSFTHSCISCSPTGFIPLRPSNQGLPLQRRVTALWLQDAAWSKTLQSTALSKHEDWKVLLPQSHDRLPMPPRAWAWQFCTKTF